MKKLLLPLFIFLIQFVFKDPLDWGSFDPVYYEYDMYIMLLINDSMDNNA